VQYQYAAPQVAAPQVQYSAPTASPARSRWSTGPQDRPLSDRTRSKQAGPFGGPLFRAGFVCPAACIRGVLWISS
jgi:hypothetical protein